MKAKEKANQLVNKFIKHSRADKDLKPIESAKQCALIAVDQIILANPHSNPFNTESVSTMKYWVDVRKEIDKL
jgi:hypothetical protein